MFHHSPHRNSVAELARPNHGIVTTPQLRAAGYSPQEIRTMVAKGYLHRLRRSVFAVGHLSLGDDSRRMASVRCAGHGAALDQISAGACWLITKRPDRVVNVVVPRPRRPVDNVRMRIDTRLPPTAFTTFRNIEILTPTWTIMSLAERMGPGSLTRVLREASYHRLLDMPALLRIAEGEPRSGIVTLRKALDLRTAGSAGYASRLERDVNRYVRTFDIPRFLPNVVIAGLTDDYEVDMVWHAFKVCVEIDGPIHDDPDVQREDRMRTADLEAAGWTVIRIHWSVWEADRAAAVAPLIALLQGRS